MSEQKQVRLGLIGCGNISRAHHRNVSEGKVPNCKITAVCDTDPEAMKQYDQYQHFADHHALIASGEVDAILICTPHYSHVPIAIDGLQAGVHVLIEKPLSPYGADCQKLIDAYEAREDKSLICGEMFNQRTDPRYIKLKELIESGELGQLKRISWTITDWFRSDTYYASGGWRATWSGEGGGVLLNQSPHQLDLFQWIFGMPDRVQAHCHIGKWHDIEVEDDVTAYMEYDSGATATFVSTTGEAPGVNRLEVACDRGLITVVDDGLEWTRLEQGISQFSKETKESFGRPPRWEIKIPTKVEQDHSTPAFWKTSVPPFLMVPN